MKSVLSIGHRQVGVKATGSSNVTQLLETLGRNDVGMR